MDEGNIEAVIRKAQSTAKRERSNYRESASESAGEQRGESIDFSTASAQDPFAETHSNTRGSQRRVKNTKIGSEIADKFAGELLDNINMVAGLFLGNQGQMNILERAMIEPRLAKRIAAAPVEQLEKTTGYMDTGILVGGIGMYLYRISTLIVHSRPQKKQEMPKEPQGKVEKESNISRDGNGMAAPAPEIIRQHHIDIGGIE